jgi:hypothetical protein
MSRDFVIREQEYPRVPELLLEEAPLFRDSEDYRQLDSVDLALPSVVMGAFRQYVERLTTSAAAAPLENTEAFAAFSAFERLASSADPEVANALVVDIFEHLSLTKGRLNDFYEHLGPSARDLYDRWIGRPEA